jgi:DNA-binding NarL/FixJ family response regulator
VTVAGDNGRHEHADCQPNVASAAQLAPSPASVPPAPRPGERPGASPRSRWSRRTRTQTLFAAIKAGAQGYPVKNARSREFLEQLRGLARGEAAISRRLAARILDEIRGQAEPFRPEEALTARELEVLELVAARLSNAEIAERLAVSGHTVKNHMKSILAQLRLHNRRQGGHTWLT